MASLERGEVVPGRREIHKEGPPQEPLLVHSPPDSHSKQRIRTISAVNEHLLAQLSLQEGVVPSSSLRAPPSSASAPTNNNSNPHHQHPHNNNNTLPPPVPGRPPLPSQSSRSRLMVAPPPSSDELQPVELVKSASMPHSYASTDSLELSPDNTHFHRHRHDDESDNNKNAGAGTAAGDADTQLMGIDLLDGAELSSPEQQHSDDSNGQPKPAAPPADKNKQNKTTIKI